MASKLKFVTAGAALLMLSLISSASMAGQVTGAIFTTLVDGSSVNHNIYNAKQDVYLNGGPNSPNAPCTAAGLPNGDYYFQVTDPSGKILLSTDSLAQRKVRVAGRTHHGLSWYHPPVGNRQVRQCDGWLDAV